MSSELLEQTLRDLPRIGTLIKKREYRQVWRFDFNGKGYYLKFYPRAGIRDWWRRRFRGSPATREFQRLQWLQKAKVPAPRGVALLIGFTLDGEKGDAVILHAIEPSVSLDQLLNDQALAGDFPASQRRRLADQLIELVHQLGHAGYGHDDLHLGNFLLHDDKLHLIDAYAVRKGGLRIADVLLLGASVSRFATTADLVRGWRKLAGGAPLPLTNAASGKIWESQLFRITRDNRYFGKFKSGPWSGIFYKETKYPRRWSGVSQLKISASEWESAAAQLLLRMQGGKLKTVKAGPSGNVSEAALHLDGRDVEVIVKSPRRRYWYRYLTEIGRGARPRRAWRKAWELVIRDLPTAWPIAFFERRRLGYVMDSFIVMEKVPGPTLWKIDLEALSPAGRDGLFRRTGWLLRQIERYGFSHFDAKASNWIIRPDAQIGPMPVLIDVDGIRKRRWIGLGIQRLLRSLLDRRQYSPADSLALCQGYAPFARFEQENTSSAEAVPAPVDAQPTANSELPNE